MRMYLTNYTNINRLRRRPMFSSIMFGEIPRCFFQSKNFLENNFIFVRYCFKQRPSLPLAVQAFDLTKVDLPIFILFVQVGS